MEHNIQIIQTRAYKSWFDGLRDRHAQKHILVRIGRLERGNFGDVKAIDEGNRVMANSSATIPWDAIDYLKSDADMAEYLAAAFETGDVGDVTHALANVARARGMTETARNAGLARGSLYKAIGEGANPTLSTLLSVLSAMNISLSAKSKLAV